MEHDINVPATAGADDKLSENFKLYMIRENLYHAKHIENERMTFTSIFTAITGGFLAAATKIDSSAFSFLPFTMTCVLIALAVICILLILRWNGVFAAHMEIARELIQSAAGRDTPRPDWRAGTPEERKINDYFIFKFNLETNTDARLYYRTGNLFLIYACFMLALLVMCAILFAGQI